MVNFIELIEKAEVAVFDLGAVILNIDPQRAVKEFIKLGLPDFSDALVQTNAHDIFDDFERGSISPSAFRAQLSALSGARVSDDEFDAAWNSMLLDFPCERVRAIQRCATVRPTYLLSNTNEIHFNRYATQLQHCGVAHLSDLFVEAFYSHKLGMRKPDSEIFEFLIDRLGVPASKIVFFDDNAKNIASASNLSICAVHVVDGMDIANLF